MKPDAEGWFEYKWSASCLLATNLRCSQRQAVVACTATYLQFRNGLFNLLNFHLAETFDLQQRLACGSVDRLGSVR